MEPNQEQTNNLLNIAEALTVLADKHKYNKLEFMFPEKGPFRKELYKKHIEFFEKGKDHLIRAFIGGNGTGKTVLGAVETAYHLTGRYPKDWKGRKFNHPIKAWGCARENKQLREAMQEALFGNYSDQGTGLIPKDCLVDDKGIVQTYAMAGTAGCIGHASVKHYTNGVYDGNSEIYFKTYAQGWQEFQGSNRHWIWLDEEPDDAKVYAECLARTRGPAGKEGSLICTFTPLLGYSTVYLSFFPNGQRPKDGIHPENREKFVSVVTWNDIPHLSEKVKASMIAEWKLSDPNSIEARVNGVASVGSGRIYPIDESFVVVPPFKIPPYWKKAYGLDPGWTNTAVIWIAEDPDTKIKYVYSEYKHGKVLYLIHAQAIKDKGEWLHGAIDPHEARKPRDDGGTVQEYFESLGLNLVEASGDPHASRARIYGMFEAGSLKIVSTCQKLLEEVRVYRYDLNDPNKPARNQDDHLCDAMAYALLKFDEIAESQLDIEEEEYNSRTDNKIRQDNNRNDVTGY